MQVENEELKNDGTQKFLNTLFPLLIEVANYSELITLPEFWKHFATIKDNHYRNNIIQQICRFYQCDNCGFRLRRGGDSSWFCYSCSAKSSNFHDDFTKFARFDCLKCFKLYSTESFASSECKHLCGYCIAKELKKERRNCRICIRPYEQPNAAADCVLCNSKTFFGDLNEMRCGCRYCDSCFLNVKKAKKCLKCVGINILTSELYDFNKKSFEICFVCGEDKKILIEEGRSRKSEFVISECCNLDICVGCKKSSQLNYCIGCEQTPK